ncbi:hypothetical protein [Hydrogenophaga sp. OTU3427]|uniref:hypothetical protein n=1 Tax=Hydrogenophaga sp. OTU3427 TaxID=3043856 RepID=UPI00313BB592
MKTTVFFAAALSTLPALAHDGHGLFGSHWHASDALGFVAVAALAAAFLWFTRGGK